MRYDLTSLEIFVAVAETGSLTKAAELQHLAISAVSKRISDLEELTGTPLLSRHARGITVTPAGQSLLRYAHRILRLIDNMHGELCEYSGGLSGIVRLHASTSSLVEFLPPELQSFMDHYPKVRLQIEERTGGAIAKAVSEGAADIGILGDHVPMTGLNRLSYHADRLVLAVPNRHKLRGKSSLYFWEALEFAIVGPHADSSLWQVMLQAADSAHRTLEPKIQVSSFECICLLVEAGLGVAVLPEMVLKARAEQGKLSIVNLNDSWANRQLVIVFKGAIETLPLTARALIEHLRKGVEGH